MLDLKKIYDSVLDEDAVMAAGAGAGAVSGGEIAAPIGVGDADIVKGGMSTDDVLGKDCDHHKDGYLGPGCFHMPSRVCKLKREIPSGIKKKGQKNIYAKGMKILTDSDIDEIVNAICESSLVDEDFKDTLRNIWSKVKGSMSKPADYIKNVLDKDAELIKKTEHNLKMMPREDLAAIYSAEFADASIVDDLIDMVSMLKDILLLRYKHIPWRTAISACILLAYILSPYNITLGTGLTKYVGRNTAKAGAVAAKIVSFMSRGSMLGTEMLKKIPNVNVWEFDFAKTIEKINNGEYDPDLLKAVEPYLNCLDELAIVYVLWKWFRKDLKKYRMWLAAKLKAKDQLKNVDEAELDKDTILAIHSTPEEDIVAFVKGYDPKAQYIDAIAYYPVERKYFIKYNIGGSSKFIIADFDGKSFINDPNSNDKKTYSGKEVKNMYKDAGTKMKMWVVYGYEE